MLGKSDLVLLVFGQFCFIFVVHIPVYRTGLVIFGLFGGCFGALFV